MVACFFTEEGKATPISIVTPKSYADWLAVQSEVTKTWLANAKFVAEACAIQIIPDANGHLAHVVVCIDNVKKFGSTSHLPLILPEGRYLFDNIEADHLADAVIAWGLGAYQFTRYKKASRQPATLFVPKNILNEVNNTVESIYLVRDLINTPTDDLGPTELAKTAKELAQTFGAKYSEIVGDELLSQNYPMIHAVGRACDDAPRLIDFSWGDAKHPRVTLVGKGVCFDTGGLDIKGAPFMLLMKKDMGGAANVLGLARMIMEAKLPICLRVLIPAVENSISGNAYRPGDVLRSRSGKTIEIGNTDAEGRLVLADAITEAVSEKPALLIDMATLTGAARIAVGTDIAAVFANDDEVVANVIKSGDECNDPMWRMPLFAGYRDALNSSIADMNNTSPDSYAGAITAALFLKEFVPNDIAWLHFDIMAWNLRARIGKLIGGEAMAIRGLFKYLERRFV